MLTVRCISWLLFTLALLPRTLAWRSYDIGLLNFTTLLVNRDYISNFDVGLVALDGRNAINGTVQLSQELTDFTVDTSVETSRGEQNVFQIADIKIDACDIFNNKRSNIMRILLTEFQKTKGYFPDSCPVLANRPIAIENFVLNADSFPPYMPEFIFRAEFNLRKANVYILKTLTYGNVFNRKKLQGVHLTMKPRSHPA